MRLSIVFLKNFSDLKLDRGLIKYKMTCNPAYNRGFALSLNQWEDVGENIVGQTVALLVYPLLRDFTLYICNLAQWSSAQVD